MSLKSSRHRKLSKFVTEPLDEELLAESREQYLRYAMAIWEQCVQPDGVRDPARAVQSLEVLCMLFDGE